MDETFSEKRRDLEALLSFRNGIKADPMHSLSNWTCNNSENVCSSWNGVFCRKLGTHTLVVAIILPHLGLEGTISPSIANLPFLEILNLSSNHLQGRIPSELGQLKALRLLDLNSNLLKGSIPTSLSNCTHLQWIILSTNNLTGNIPARLGGLGSLRYLRLSYNDLTGTVPDSFVNCTFLQWITLSSNNLYGGIPPTLGNCTSLRKIKLSDNFFTGCFDIGYSSSLEVLSAHTNNFSGTLPASLANSTELQLLDFRRNRLRDELPWYLANFQKLRVLSLGYNELHGRLPALMVNLTNLQVLDLSNNMFDGGIPSDLENLKGFGVLGDPQVSGNTLYEDIPMVIKGKEYGLEYVLAANTILDLSSNNLSGWIPESIGNLSSLRLLNLSGNRLEGAIPASLGQIWTLEQLDLCRNELRGRIPEELTLLSLLVYLDLSSNRLCGEIPRGTQLETFTAKAFDRNLCLCGGPLQSCSAKNNATPDPLPLATTNFESIWSVIHENVSMAALALGFGIAFLGTMSVIIWGGRVWFCITAIKVQDSPLCSWSFGYSLRFTFHSFTSATIAPP